MKTLLTIPPKREPSVFLKSNSDAYEWFIRKIQTMDPKKEGETVLRSVERSAWFAGYFHTGRFVDGAIENLAFNIGTDLDAHPVKLKGFSLPIVCKDGRRRVLHVTPGLAMGGHRQLLYHWVCNDSTSCHSLVLVDHSGDVPKRFDEVIRNSGGSLVTLPQGAGLCQKAQLLREMARSNADLVVWHLIGTDVIPIAAFATQECPPVILIDHCDHLFWLGSSVADLVVNLRTAGAELTAERRFTSCTTVIPIPLLDPKVEMSRIDARQVLGIGEDQVMLLSIGRAEKYRPYGSYDFVATANKILDRQPNAHLYVVGESVAAITPFLHCATHNRLHFMGSMEDLSVYRMAADIYLESFPFGSQTALLEAALSGLPVVPAYAPLFPMLVANDDALMDILRNPKTEQEFINQVELLICEPEKRLVLGDALRKRLLVDHVGKGWLGRLDALYQKTDQLKHSPQLIPNSSCMMTDIDINLSQWHVMADKPQSPTTPDDDIRAVLCHTAFVAKTVGDYATARWYAWRAVKHDPYQRLAWRLLTIALLGRTGYYIRRKVDSIGQLLRYSEGRRGSLRLYLLSWVKPMIAGGLTGIRRAVDNMLTALVLRWQRFNIRLPEAVLRPVRSLLARLVESKANAQSLEDWSTPLIIGGKAIDDSVVSSEAARVSESGAMLPPSTNPPDTADLVVQPQNGLRCLLVTSALDVGGMDEVVVFLARGLPRYNIHTAVLHASMEDSLDGIPSGRLGRLLLECGVETVELAADQATYWLEAWRPDVISAHGAPSWVLKVATRLSIPYLDTLHGMHSHFGAKWAAEAERSRRLTGIVAVSELVRRQYLNGNPAFSPERIVTIPNGVDNERRNPGNRNSFRARLGIRDEYLFVSLARHCLQKNTYGLVAAFEDVATKHPEAHLVIAGHPSDEIYFNQVLSLRARLACRDRVHLRDHTPNPAQLLAAADGFVLDSFFEGWSLASMEALYVGVPVVLSEVGGAREQVGENEERGHVIPNPLGDPLRVDWETMRKARFARQVNREALVVAMSSLITDRASWLDRRQRLISESAMRFHPDICLRSHAQVLMAAVHGEPLQYEGVLQEGRSHG